ncbi:MAG: monovalent cation:proton antiporter-2 (CPA2) family protein [Nitrospirota bacterium]|nr:monovalent cation:proton antiporter-2 (CPA2) family protein [Nitrospirota bacterium]
MNTVYLTDIIIMLTAAVIAVPFFQALGLGAVPGFLIAGVLVGPSGLSLIDNVTEISHLAELGVVLFLFVIGIELKPSRLWLMRRLVFGLGSLQVLGTGFLIAAIVHFLFDMPLAASILIGPVMALSSTAFVLQLLSEQKKMHSEYGRVAFSVLLLQDLAVVPLLALVSLLSMPELTIGEEVALALAHALGILVLVILGGRYLLHPILHRVARYGAPEVFTASAVLLVLGTAILTERVGLSMAMGAFVAGLLIADSSYRHQVSAEIQPFRGLLLGLFFMSMGMSLNLRLLFEQPLLSLGLTAALMSTKILVLWPATRLFGLRGKTDLAVSLLLSQSGEFALVLFALALQTGLLPEPVFQQLLLIVLLSMLATPPLARLADQMTNNRRLPNKETPLETPPSSPIVIAGFGQVGSRIGQILSMAEQPFVALDLDSELVSREGMKGHPVFFGDAQNPEVLRAVGAGDTRLVIVTVNDFAAAERIVSSLHQAHPKLDILARGHNLKQCQALRKLGAPVVVSENIEASLKLAQAALTRVGGKKSENEALLEKFRQNYYGQIESVLKNETPKQ